MSLPNTLSSNFSYLQEHDEQLLRLGMLAEKYFAEDPNTSLFPYMWICIGDDDSGHISLIYAKVARFDSDAVQI